MFCCQCLSNEVLHFGVNPFMTQIEMKSTLVSVTLRNASDTAENWFRPIVLSLNAEKHFLCVGIVV